MRHFYADKNDILRSKIHPPVFKMRFATSFSVSDKREEDSVNKVDFPDLYEAGILEIQNGLEDGLFTSVDLVKAYFARIDEVNLQGAALRAVLETNPSALGEAAILDLERKTSGSRGSLHGIPVLVKDNIATVASEGMNTTAGSFALLGSIVPRDAFVISQLRKAGAIILGMLPYALVMWQLEYLQITGKTNPSEWAHFRGNVASGWSGRGGQTTNPYFPNADPCGSSSGSGVAAAIGLSTVTLGTETDGSITCPTSNNNAVGIKPTVGLTSRSGVGPIVRSVTDAAIVLGAMAGRDPTDNFTLAQPPIVPDYTKALDKNSLKGKRIGVPRRVFLNDSLSGNDPSVNVIFEEALGVMRSLGATIVDPADLPSAEEIAVSNNETIVLDVDFKVQLNQYFADLLENPTGVRTLAELIAFDNSHPAEEEPKNFTDQSTLIESEATTGRNGTYEIALAADHELGRTRGIDAALKQFNLDALVLPAPGLTTVPAAIAGYPIVTVPLGFYPNNVTIGSAGPLTVYPAPGVPLGLSFLGTAFDEFNLIGLAFAYEQATHTRLARKAFPAAIPSTQLGDILKK
ncbi:hypothetical protein Clacol_008885 [Clathrus columnatus]|uniref:Amidase domain-containing protein n=1 Tax=Clathrus columnatus TaxID=1419009 RepID=A0AAV5APJ7_9AGAM|nr:hypothetical protein Clacol_008885 [Clathrus columnatus]